MQVQSYIKILRIMNEPSGVVHIEIRCTSETFVMGISGDIHSFPTESTSIVRLYVTAAGRPASPLLTDPGLFFKNVLYALEHRTELIDQRKEARTRALIDIGGVETNNLENISGLAGAAQIIHTLRDGYVAFKNLNVVAALRFLADAYLIYKYAIMATGRDVQTLQRLGPGKTTNAKTNVFAQVPTPKMMNKVALAA
jgi:hypothetical protein